MTEPKDRREKERRKTRTKKSVGEMDGEREGERNLEDYGRKKTVMAGKWMIVYQAGNAVVSVFILVSVHVWLSLFQRNSLSKNK